PPAALNVPPPAATSAPSLVAQAVSLVKRLWSVRRYRRLAIAGMVLLVIGVTDGIRAPKVISTITTNARGYSLLEEGHPEEALRDVRDAEKLLEDESKEGKRVSLVLADLLAGTAAARSGDLGLARARLASQGKLYKATDPSEKWWHQTLAGEIALAAGDPQSA